MVEIYNIGFPSHERFARDQKEVEAFEKQFHLSTTSRFIDVQTTIPKQTAVDLLLGGFVRSSWARFSMPAGYEAQSLSSIPYIAPSLGNSEKQEADILRIRGYLDQLTNNRFDQEKENRKKKKKDEGPENEEEELCGEGDAIIQMLDEGVMETNAMIDFVSARTKQFIQV